MFTSPPYTHCPVGAWTTLFRGPVLPFGIISIETKGPTPVSPKYEFKVASVSPPYYYTGSATGACGIPTGATPWAEFAVRPKVTCYLRATGY